MAKKESKEKTVKKSGISEKKVLSKKEPVKDKIIAVIQTGGKQYKVEEGQEILIEKLEGEEGKKITFSDLLLIALENKVNVGKPLIESAKVEGKILSQEKGKKVVVFKMKSKKRYRKKAGHRQKLTRIKIEKISA